MSTLNHSLDTMFSSYIGPNQSAAKDVFRMLVAEDTHSTRQLLLSAFGERDMQIDTAVDGNEAVELFSQHHYDIVLTDLQMPQMDGIRAARRMRTIESEEVDRRRTPIIAITAETRPATRAACLAVGIDVCMWKPIDLDALSSTVERLTSSKPRESCEIQPASDDGQPNAGGSQPFELEQALARLRGDLNLFRKLSQMFAEDQRKLLLEADKAIREKNAEMLERTAHTLKGMAANFDAKQVGLQAAQLEQLGRDKDFTQAHALLPELQREIGVLLAALRPYLEGRE